MDDEFGIGADNGGSEEFVFRVGKKLDEAVAEVGGVGSRNRGERKDSLLAVEVLFDTIVFGEASSGDGGKSVGKADEAFVIAKIFGFADGIGGGEGAFVGCAFGG